MQFTGPNPWVAPVVTGHPLGLPGTLTKAAPDMRVQPVDARARAETALSSGQPPAQFWTAARGEPDPATHVAPPSIMQIKISQMLDAQASKQAEDATESAAQEQPAPEPNAVSADGGEVAETDGQDAEADVAKANTPPDATADQPPAAPTQSYDPVESLSRSSVFSTLP